MVQDRTILTMADLRSKSSGTTFKDLERPLTPISRLCHYLSLNISETAKDIAIVAVKGE